MSWRGLAKRERSPSSAISVAALTNAMPRIVCSAATTGASVQSGNIASICAVSRSRRLNRLNVVLEHNVMRRLVEAQTRQPTAVQFGSCRTAIMTALAQQEPRELLPCPPQRPHRIEAGPYLITHRLMSGIGNPHHGQLARPVQLRRTGCIPPIGLDPVTRSPWDQRGGNDNAVVPGRRQL